jgi:transposase
MDLNQSVSEHYRRLLLLPKPWQVSIVKEDIPGELLEVVLSWPKGLAVACPDCGKECSLHDHAQERSWRHLSVMQYHLHLRCAVPRCHCPEHGVKTINVPWAEPGARFTRSFESFALVVIMASRSLSQAADVLELDWGGIQRILDRAVVRGLERRSVEGLVHVGLDEKSFLRGQNYVSQMTDLKGRRILEVVEGHTAEDAVRLWQSLSQGQRAGIEAVAMDMSAGFAKATKQEVPQADIVIDRFHVAKLANEAVNLTRREEAVDLAKVGDDSLKQTRFWFLSGAAPKPENRERFEELLEMNLKTSEAWAYKEQLVEFYGQSDRECGKDFLAQWVAEVMASGLAKMKKVARTVVKHEEGLLNWFEHRISNGMTEGFNSVIQSLKSAARGFRNFANYRVRILFFCGKLNVMPKF